MGAGCWGVYIYIYGGVEREINIEKVYCTSVDRFSISEALLSRCLHTILLFGGRLEPGAAVD